MRLTRTSAWVGGTALLCVLLAVATWFLLVAPQRDEAASLREQTASTAEQNVSFAAMNAILERQFAELPATRAELAELREQIPTDADLPTLLRQVSGLADRSGATLRTFSPVEPAPSTDPVVAEAVADGTPVPQTIPLTLEATGSFVQVQELLRLLQTELPRSMLVQGVTMTADESTGGLTMSLTTQVFALPDATTGVAALPAEPESATGAEAVPDEPDATAPSPEPTTPQGDVVDAAPATTAPTEEPL